MIRVGDRVGETRSTSRREIATRIFEVAGRAVPSFEQVSYPGHPLAWEAPRIRVAGLLAYVLVPGLLLVVGAGATLRRRKE